MSDKVDVTAKAHIKAVARFERLWLQYHGFPCRTFPFSTMTVEEIDALIQVEIDEFEDGEVTEL